MKKNAPAIIVTGIILILAAAVVGLLFYIKNLAPQTRGIQPLIEVALMEPDSSKWGQNFPNQYATFLMTEANNTRTTYGGSEPFSKLEADPRLLILFGGYSFSIEYNEERGHANALTDVRAIARVNETTPGTCYSCKSSNNPSLWDEMGMAAYDATPFSELGAHITNPIGCANCHDAETMALVVTNPALEAGLKAQGLDWTTFTRQQMRTVVCANCHVEYYFEGDGKFLTFPWENGTNIDNIAEYYAEDGFTDWTHPDSGTAMVKMQHPEYEMYTSDSTHYMAGVACADCHMPYTRDGSAKFSSHNVMSPLLNAEAACGTCHTDVEYVTGRVAIIQELSHTTLLATEDALVSCIEAIEAAKAAGATDAALADARALHREAQLRWDFVAAENSMGFHNPEEVLRTLALATDMARQAEIAAMEATP